MTRSRLLLVAGITLSFAVAGVAFRASVPTIAKVGSLVSAGEMLNPRSGHTATLLPDGKVLIAGGMRRNQDFYNPPNSSIRLTGNFSRQER